MELEKDCQIQTILKSSEPEITNFYTELQWLVGCLKNIIFCTEDGLTIKALSDQDLAGGFPERLLIAWNDDELRKGYLPILPKRYVNILEIVETWNKNQNEIVYLVEDSSQKRIACFIDMIFYVGNKKDIKIDINYGTINKEFLNKGVLTKALKTIIKCLQTEIERCGFSLTEITTKVSDRNMASRRVLEKAGFSIKKLKKPDPSPIEMGGENLIANLNLN